MSEIVCEEQVNLCGAHELCGVDIVVEWGPELRALEGGWGGRICPPCQLSSYES